MLQRPEDCSGGQGWQRGWGTLKAAGTVERALNGSRRLSVQAFRGALPGSSQPPCWVTRLHRGCGSEKAVKEPAQGKWPVSGRVGIQTGLSPPDLGP